MIVENRASIVGESEVRKNLLDILEAAVDAVDPYTCVRGALSRDGDILSIGEREFDLSTFDGVTVVGAGKASRRMVEAVVDVLGDRITRGFVNSPSDGAVGKIRLHRSSHPHPDREGLAGSLEIRRLCESAGERDLIICLVSGGGSSMMPCPADGIGLEEKKRTAELLMLRGASIDELNTVRRHLSCLKGGNLAKLAYPATVLSLIVSDVVGDRLESISSGPTAPDPTSRSDAIRVLGRYGLMEEVPSSVVQHLNSEASETPKPGDVVFRKVANVIVGSNRIALLAAERRGRELGYNTLLLTSSIEGEAREVGRVLCAIGNEIAETASPVAVPALVIAGGETTVTVRGGGRGGRNCELVLSAAQKLGAGLTVLSFGTDGIDGTSGAGGAIGDRSTWSEDAFGFLADNDSARYLGQRGGLIVTGPTGTNVGDVILTAVGKAEPR